MDLLTGNLASYVLKHILTDYDASNQYNTPLVIGYFREGDKYTCFDNTSRNCWVEQATTEEMAVRWCQSEIEADELYFT